MTIKARGGNGWFAPAGGVTTQKTERYREFQICGRAVARIFEWGGQLASEASKLRTRRFAPSSRGGSGAQPPTGSRGGAPGGGLGGRSPPKNFCKNTR